MMGFKNIEYLDINNMTLEELNSKFFHFCSNNYSNAFDTVGIKPRIGKNSVGLDTEPSIFFSKGVEGILEVWDVWFKWKLNRLYNPLHNQNAKEEDIINWYYYYTNKEFYNNEEILSGTFDHMIEEMENSSYYLLDLIENEEFKYDQIDHKKVEAIKNAKINGRINPMTQIMYGEYSRFDTPIVDKWNMQTIPGKDITITPDRIKVLCADGKTDVMTILLNLYERYQNESINKVDLPMLDKFVEYVNNKNMKL